MIGKKSLFIFNYSTLIYPLFFNLVIDFKLKLVYILLVEAGLSDTKYRRKVK
jgi:hypothetical protein